MLSSPCFLRTCFEVDKGNKHSQLFLQLMAMVTQNDEDIADDQLVESCKRLDGRRRMLITFISDLDHEKLALQAQRHLLQRRIAEFELLAAESATWAAPPQGLQLKRLPGGDHGASGVELTWCFEAGQLRSCGFEVQQVSHGVGRLRIRTLQCHEPRCVMDMPGKACIFQVRTCGIVEVEGVEHRVVSAFCEPISLHDVERSDNVEKPATVAEMPEGGTSLEPPVNPSASESAEAVEVEQNRDESNASGSMAEMVEILEKTRAELKEERDQYQELWTINQIQSSEMVALKEELAEQRHSSEQTKKLLEFHQLQQQEAERQKAIDREVMLSLQLSLQQSELREAEAKESEAELRQKVEQDRVRMEIMEHEQQVACKKPAVAAVAASPRRKDEEMTGMTIHLREAPVSPLKANASPPVVHRVAQSVQLPVASHADALGPTVMQLPRRFGGEHREMPRSHVNQELQGWPVPTLQMSLWRR